MRLVYGQVNPSLPTKAIPKAASCCTNGRGGGHHGQGPSLRWDNAVGTCGCSNMGTGVTSQKDEVRGYTLQEGLYKRGTGQAVPLAVKAALPVLELSCHSLGDTSTHQADQEQYADAPTDHGENVVL